MHQTLCLAFVVFSLVFVRPETSWAASLTFSGAPTTIANDDPFEIDVNLAGGTSSKNKINYLRAVFFVADSTKYFGYTQSARGEWGNSASQKDTLLAITLNEEGSWSGKLRSKVDLSSSYYNDSGTYYFKVGRYTSESDTSAQWSETEVPVHITFQLSPTPQPTPKPSSTPKPQAISKSSSAPTPDSDPTPQANPTLSSSKPSPTSIHRVLGATSSARFLQTGIINKLPTQTPTPPVHTSAANGTKKESSTLVAAFVALGAAISLAGISPWLKKQLGSRLKFKKWQA